MIDNTLLFFNLKDENDEPLDIARIVGEGITNWLKKIVGRENWERISKEFKKWSAIYTAAANILQQLTNIMAGLAEACETIAEMLGTIGNAIKGAGLIFENAYGWLSETFTFKTGRLAVLNKISSGLMNVSETVDTLTEVSEEFLEVREESIAIGNSVNQLKDAIEQSTNEKQQQQNTKKQNSQFQGEITPQALATP
ncbi:MAG: hypothetical protein QXM92_01535 [Candidatus Anstonellales archaeon]